MAWEEFNRHGVIGITGDKPIDEFALVLKKISTVYEDRFSRKPTITELLHALETVIASNPTYYVSDPEGLRFGTIIVERDFNRERDYIDTSQYEGVYTDASIPGYYLILRRNLDKNNQDYSEVIKIPSLEVRDGLQHDLTHPTLICEYEILTNDITDKMAETLILKVLIQDFLDNFYIEQTNMIKFKNLKSNHSWIMQWM